MKKVLLLLSLIVLTACGEHNVGVVDNKRMLVSGNILDAENTPIEDISVTASGSEHAFLDAMPNEILGEGFTNNSGEFSFVSLDTDNSFYGVSINHPNHDEYSEDYSTIHFLDSIGKRGNSYELVNVKLKKALEFVFKMQNTSGRNDTLFYKLSYSNSEEYRKLNENSFSENPFSFQNEIEQGFRLLPTTTERNITARTLQNTAIQFRYKFSAEAVYDTINVEITPENPVYEFNF